MKNQEHESADSHLAAKVPEVGIFWLYQQKLLKSAVPLADGMEYGEFINGPTGHYEYWGKASNRIPEVRDREYDQVPRGRVVYSMKEKTFYVYASKKTIGSSALKDRIASAFRLADETIAFRSDEHYEDVTECPLENEGDVFEKFLGQTTKLFCFALMAGMIGR